MLSGSSNSRSISIDRCQVVPLGESNVTPTVVPTIVDLSLERYVKWFHWVRVS